MQLDARADALAVEDVRALWPPGVAPPSRKWALENVLQGDIRDARLSLRLDATGKPEIGLTFRFADGRALPVPGLPEVENAGGFFSLQDHQLAVALDSAGMTAPDGGAVEISAGRIGKSDTSDRDAPLEVAARAEATASAGGPTPRPAPPLRTAGALPCPKGRPRPEAARALRHFPGAQTGPIFAMRPPWRPCRSLPAPTSGLKCPNRGAPERGHLGVAARP